VLGVNAFSGADVLATVVVGVVWADDDPVFARTRPKKPPPMRPTASPPIAIFLLRMSTPSVSAEQSLDVSTVPNEGETTVSRRFRLGGSSFRFSSGFWEQTGVVKLLLVEDEPRLAVSLRKGLGAEGHSVEIAGDGEQGLWMAQNSPFDAIVLDIMLPKLNGFQVCSQLRASGVWTPILMLTAKDGEHDIAEALDTGADDYLVKPFSLVELSARLRALTRRGGTERPTILVVDDLSIDPSRRRCSRGDVEISLTPKEYTVLEYLMRRRGEAVAKSEILAQGWDFAYDGDPNIVEVYVSNLRRKIDAPFGTSNLRTVWGVGYEMASADVEPSVDVERSRAAER
jgi:DNA-binding response OmpR family regulator